LILALENCRDALSPGGIVMDTWSFFFEPLLDIRRPRVKLLNLRIGGEEIGEELRGMWNLAEGQTLGLHEQLS
jgi:hypothetical protein